MDHALGNGTVTPPTGTDRIGTELAHRLYLLALGGCVFNTQGGYGSWGLLIGGNLTCTWRQRVIKKSIENPFEWKDPPTVTETQEARLTEPLFLEPMDY
jgi:hypothetical protein